MLARITLYELQTALHRDRGDKLCATFCAGRFEGGEGLLPDLNAKVEYVFYFLLWYVIAETVVDTGRETFSYSTLQRCGTWLHRGGPAISSRVIVFRPAASLVYTPRIRTPLNVYCATIG